MSSIHARFARCAAFTLLFASTSDAIAQSDNQLADRDQMLAVESALRASPGLSAHRVDVDVENGVVRLSGAIHSALARRLAGEIAEAINGTLAVTNDIEVVSPNRPVSDLQADIAATMGALPGTRSATLNVTVHEGEVTIAGSVSDWAEHDFLSKLLESIRGVQSVRNDTHIEYGAHIDDADLRAQVQRRLKTNVWTADVPVQTTVLQGQLKLAGLVPSPAHRTAILRVAPIPGIKSIDPTDLIVDPATWAGRRSSQAALAADRDLDQIVQESFTYDPLARHAALEVEHRGDGIVLLGSAADLRTRRAAEECAANVRGVSRVDNRIRVRPDGEPPADAELEELVASALDRDSELSGLEVEIRARNGEVRLSGKNASRFERHRAELVAEGVRGVVSIDNRLETQLQRPQVCIDNVTRKTIEDLIAWNAFLQSGSITVTVANCHAVLTGSASDSHARQWAEQLALGSGPLSVENQISLGTRPER